MMKRMVLIAMLLLVPAGQAQMPSSEPKQPTEPARPAVPATPKAPPLVPGGSLGVWWRDPNLAQRIGLNSDQLKSIESIWRNNRATLAGLISALDKEQTAMASLLKAEKPDEMKIATQIDRAVEARAALEKANARMLLGIRMLMTLDEWERLQRERPSVFSALLPATPVRPTLPTRTPHP